MLRTVPLNVWLGLVLLATGGLALQTNSHPSQGMAIWPPTGIGLAAVMVFGRRVLPAIALSTFCLFAGTYSIDQNLGPTPRLLVPAFVGIGFVLQAQFGVWLLHKTIGTSQPLTSGWDILRFLLIAGPVHTLPLCLLASTLIGNDPTLSWEELASTTGEWWWSEAVGGAVFTPVALAFLASPATVWRPRRLTLALPLLVAIVTVSVLQSVANRWDERTVRWKLESDSATAAGEIGSEFQRFVTTLNRARSFIPYEWNALLPGSKGRLFPVIDNFRQSYPFVNRIGMAFEVAGADLDSYRTKVAAFSRETHPVRIWKYSPDRTVLEVEPRPNHLPVLFSYPSDGTPWPEGFDLSSDSRTVASLEGARTTFRPTLFEIGTSEGREEWFVFVPLTANEQAPVESRAVSGFLVVGIDPARLIARADGSVRSAGVRYTWLPAGGHPPRTDVSTIQTLSLAGNEYRLLAIADPSFVKSYKTSLTWVVAVIGIGLSTLFTALLLVMTGRAAVVAEAVAARTAALHAEIESRAEIEENLRASETRLAEAQRIAHLGAWEWDADPDVISWTDELTVILGPPPGPDPSLADLLSFVNPEDRVNAEHLVKSAAEQNRSGEIEIRIRTAGGQERVVAFKVVSVGYGFPGRTVRGTLQDVTERRRFEDKIRDTQKLESLGVLAGGIAHDFNNLLTGILGNAALIREQLPPASPYQESLRVIEHSAEHAASLCQQMLAYAGRGPSIRGPVDLNRLIEESADLLRLSVHKKIELKFDLSSGVPMLRGDASQLRQVLLNFVTNASEAVGTQGGRVTIRTGAGRPPCPGADKFHGCDRLPAAVFAWFEVEDSGCGMTPEVKARVFEPFFTTKFTGRGLGLSAVHGIVRGHEGNVCLTSDPGCGTTLRVYLPAAGEPAELLVRTPPPTSSLTAVVGMPRARVPASAPEAAPPPGGGVVVVADDEPSVRAFASTALRSTGYDVMEAADGFEAISLVTEHATIKGLVLDVTMPGMDGRKTLDMLARIRPDVPVVLMSGYSEHELQDLFSTGTVKGFVSKPFRPGDLNALVQRAIARSLRIPATN